MNNPYYSEQQMRQVPPYVNNQPHPQYQNNPHPHNTQQPYFVNPQQQNNYPPQYPPYHRQQASPNVLIIQAQNYQPLGNLTQCNFCRQLTPTYVQLRSGAFVWLMCFIIMLLTCCCWWIAFWVDSWKDEVFRCQRCGNVKAVREGGF